MDGGPLVSLRPANCAVLAAALLSAVAARGDVFLLRSGGQVEGEWTNRDESRLAGHEVRTSSGIRVRVPAAAVEQRVPQLKADLEYERLAPTYGPSIEEQWRLAQWCRENSLPHRRRGHLEAILALDPNHVAARRALGYRQHGGQWETREQHHRTAGYELYRGRWRLSQDIEIQEEKAKRDLAESEWLMKLKRWRNDLTTERAAAAYQQLAALDNPLAVPALRTLLAGERSRRVKVLYLDVLYRIGDGPAVQTLINTALNDIDEEIFYETADRLKKLPPHQIVKPLITSLRDPQNTRVNRAAYLIGKTGDKRFVSPLIDALVTMHRMVQNDGPGDASSFGGDGSFALNRGGGVKIVDVPVQNRLVLEALVDLTGQNFDYEQRAWRRWYDIERSRIFAETKPADLRRSEATQAQ
jgi:hypothetical protein